MGAKTFFARLVLCVTIGLAAHTAAAADSDAKAFAENLGHTAMGIITSPGHSKTEKRQELEDLFAKNVDIDWVGKFVLGRYWKTATDEQKQRYLTNYKQFILSHYTSNLAEFTDADFEVTRVAPAENGGNIVTMRLKRPNAEDTVVDYTIRANGGQSLMVYDITVEGVSMITTQRSEFGSVISQHGLDYLIDQLGERSKKEATATK